MEPLYHGAQALFDENHAIRSPWRLQLRDNPDCGRTYDRAPDERPYPPGLIPNPRNLLEIGQYGCCISGIDIKVLLPLMESVLLQSYGVATRQKICNGRFKRFYAYRLPVHEDQSIFGHLTSNFRGAGLMGMNSQKSPISLNEPDLRWAPDRACLNQEVTTRVRCILDQLAASHREVLILCELEHYTGREAADALKIPLGTVKSRLREARRRFAELAQVEVGLEFR